MVIRALQHKHESYVENTRYISMVMKYWWTLIGYLFISPLQIAISAIFYGYQQQDKVTDLRLE